mgnify:CR=1 FL=1
MSSLITWLGAIHLLRNPFWGYFGLHLTPFLRKKPFQKSLQKKGPPKWKQVIMHMSRGSQRGRLLLFFIKADASRARWTVTEFEFKFDFSSSSNSISARVRIVVRICVQVWVDCNSKSKNCSKMAAWVGFDCKSFENNSKLSWLRLQKFRKQFEKMERADIKTQCSLSDHANWAKARRIC